LYSATTPKRNNSDASHATNIDWPVEGPAPLVRVVQQELCSLFADL